MSGSETPAFTVFRSAIGTVALRRRPHSADGSLLAWDAADSLLLQAFAELDPPRGTRILVVNDSFGGLTVPLVRADWTVTSWGDSRLAQMAIADNLARNGLAEDSVRFVASTDALSENAFDVVLLRLPSSADALCVTADALAPVLRGAKVIAGGLDKYNPPSTRELLSALGSCVMRRGEKKAHLFDVRVETDDPVLPLPAVHEFGAELGLQLVGAAGVFGAEGVDQGSRVLIDALQHAFIEESRVLPERVADLGCGTGVLGLAATVAFGNGWAGSLTGFDESFLALATARDNARRNSIVRSEFVADDGLTNYRGEPFDLIVCNPPFHQRGATSDAVAWQMMRQSLHHLVPGGEFWVVGNRHLGYHAKVARLFGNCTVRSAHPKFVVCSATKMASRGQRPGG